MSTNTSPVKRIISIILFIFCWVVISNPIGTYFDNQSFKAANRLRSVMEDHPRNFNVLTVERSSEPNSYKIGVSCCPQVTNHISPEQGKSFLIPQGEEQKLNKQMAQENELITSFRVKQLSNQQQLIVLKSSDGIDRSWYIADANSATPLFYSTAVARGRDTLYAFGGIIGLFVTAVLWMSFLGIAHMLEKMGSAHS